ncbi:MAG: hypothetical protein M1824_005481 [Vezdaea acicularis]|nr:MAG: hypothetical protein M1824_005481 [Vezdaea acicularis]
MGGVTEKRAPLHGFCTICHTKPRKWKESSLFEHLDAHKLSEVLRDRNNLIKSKKNKYVKDELLNYIHRKTAEAVESSEAPGANGAPTVPGLADSSKALKANGDPTFPGVADSPSGSRFPNLVELVDLNFGSSSAVAAVPTPGYGIYLPYVNDMPDVNHLPSSDTGELPLSFADFLEEDFYAPDGQYEVEEGPEYGYCPICGKNFKGWDENCLGAHLQNSHSSQELQLFKEEILGHVWNQDFRDELEAAFFTSFQEFLLE